MPQAKKTLENWVDILEGRKVDIKAERNKRVYNLASEHRDCFPTGAGRHKLGSSTRLIMPPPHLGPGAYRNDEYNTIYQNSNTWLTSKLGYTLQARTAPRIKKEIQEETPCPTHYQKNWCRPKKYKQDFYSFNQKSEKLKPRMLTPLKTPGPGQYEYGVKTNRKVTWPGKFNGPIHPIEPNLPQRSLKTELMVDKEYRKFKNKVAYFRMYY